MTSALSISTLLNEDSTSLLRPTSLSVLPRFLSLPRDAWEIIGHSKGGMVAVVVVGVEVVGVVEGVVVEAEKVGENAVSDRDFSHEKRDIPYS